MTCFVVVSFHLLEVFWPAVTNHYFLSQPYFISIRLMNICKKVEIFSHIENIGQICASVLSDSEDLS